jgi:LuxR family transcriptional regulator, maltose regulon positive regulatory protein
MSVSPLLRPSKFVPRPPGPNQLERHQLLSVLQQNARAKLVLVHAPAGFGKTTLMVQWHQQLTSLGQASGWITIDPEDNDAGRFSVNLRQALLPDADGITADLFDSINRCLKPQNSFTLFLDEAEHLTAPDAAHLLEVMLEYSPENFHLVVGSRTRPNLLGPRMRVRDDILELSNKQLAFQGEESRQFLQARCATPIDPDTITKLANRTEGWAAALQLAAVAISQGEPSQSVVDHLAAPRSDLFQYLSDEVLIHLPAEQRQFLLETSFLSVLSGPLCNAVTGRTDSAEVLTAFESANLLLLPVDRGQALYRYHPLFAECLRQQLRQSQAEQLPTLAHRAAEWCARAQLREDAVEYALLAEEPDYLIARIMDCIETLVVRAQFLTLRRWLRAVPARALQQRSDLLTWSAWVEIYLNDFSATERALERLREADAVAPLAAKERLSSSVLRAFLSLSRGRMNDARAESELASSLAHNFDRLNLAGLTNVQAMLAQMQGRFGEAAMLAERVAASAAEPPTLWVSLVHASMEMGLADMSLGNFTGARRHFETPARQIARHQHKAGPPLDPHQLLVALAGPAALIDYEQNKLDSAEASLERHAPFLNSMRPTYGRALWHQLRSRVCSLQGDEAGRALALQDGIAYAIRHDLGWIEATLQWEHVAFDLAHGDISHANLIARRLLGDISLALASEWIAPCDEVFGPTIGALRFLIHNGDAKQALRFLPVHISQSERQLRRFRLAKLRVLEALAFEASGDREPALEALSIAVDCGLKFGGVRTFVDEGILCLRLLRELRAGCREAPEAAKSLYLAALEESFDDTESAADSPPSAGPMSAANSPLSAREAQIMQRLTQGHSNLAVAQQLFLSPNTIKWHLGQIYVKLGVKNRTQAVHVARQLQILPRA